MVVSVPGVRETPGDEGPKLLVRRVTRLVLRTGADAAQRAVGTSSVPLVMVSVLPAPTNKLTSLLPYISYCDSA